MYPNFRPKVTNYFSLSYMTHVGWGPGPGDMCQRCHNAKSAIMPKVQFQRFSGKTHLNDLHFFFCLFAFFKTISQFFDRGAEWTLQRPWNPIFWRNSKYDNMIYLPKSFEEKRQKIVILLETLLLLSSAGP